MAQLTLIPTPVGNLEDITLRAIRELKEADLVFAEDTRTSQKLLHHLGIDKKLYPFHAHNEHQMLDNVVKHIQGVQRSALISDAGTPSISDPGFLLVRACIEASIPVTCLPGPTAFVPALVASGFPCDSFIFEGFLPHKKGRQTAWLNIQQEERTVVFYESPHRLNKFLEEAITYCGGQRKICVAREISKMFEEFVRGNLEEVKAHFDKNEPRGEIVVVLAGKTKEEKIKRNKYKEDN
jgi:16S rRNA (cytidine1402-2'-O)-methyltransferase